MPSTDSTRTPRTFGVEFEVTADVTREAMARLMVSAGLAARVASYSGNAYDVWQIKTDGSLSGRNAMEIVSPTLDWHDTAEVQRQFAALAYCFQRGGVRVNPSCGGHVHLYVGDLTGPQITALVSRYVNRQRSLINPLAGREPNNWARPVGHDDARAWGHNITTGDTYRVTGDRYRTINPNHYASRGTFEFRQGTGRDSAETMLGWVGVLVALVEAARTDADVTVPNGSPVETHLAALVAADLLAPHLARWVRGDLSAETLTDLAGEVQAEAIAAVRDALPNLFRLQGLR